MSRSQSDSLLQLAADADLLGLLYMSEEGCEEDGDRTEKKREGRGKKQEDDEEGEKEDENWKDEQEYKVDGRGRSRAVRNPKDSDDPDDMEEAEDEEACRVAIARRNEHFCPVSPSSPSSSSSSLSTPFMVRWHDSLLVAERSLFRAKLTVFV